MLRKITGFINQLMLRAYVALQVVAATEPVRLRSALTSLVILGALYVPALNTPGLAEKVAAVGVVVLPLVVGESTRRKVTPA